MALGERLFKLRKERGLSQEALAERLGTTRQAVSKWENNQGFPETEKLLQLSDFFGVSVDFLLKEEGAVSHRDGRGYYVSRETAAGYIAGQKRAGRYIGAGFMAWALAGIPFVMFAGHPVWRLLGMAVCIVTGIGAFVMAVCSEEASYHILKEEPLILDQGYLKELSAEYYNKKRIYTAVLIPSLVLYISGILAVSFTIGGGVAWSKYHSFVFLGLAAGLMGFCCCAGVLDAYELLIKNEEYSSRVTFRIKQKIRDRLRR